MAKSSTLVKIGLVGIGVTAAYMIYKAVSANAAGTEGEGSLGGTDEPLPTSTETLPNIPASAGGQVPVYFFITPEGEVQSSPSLPSGNGGSSREPERTVTFPTAESLASAAPIASTGTGALFQDAAVIGAGMGANLLLPVAAKGVRSLFKETAEETAQSKFAKWLADPYNLAGIETRKAEKVALKIGEKAEKTGLREAEETALGTVPKWAKGLKAAANYIPFIDVPIGAALDVYFSKYETDPSKKIDVFSAIKANVAGELAQLGFTGGAAALGTVVPVAGNIAGGIGGFIIGGAADIAATEASYKAMGKSSLFDIGTTPTKLGTPLSSQVISAITAPAKPVDIKTGMSTLPAVAGSKPASSKQTTAKAVTAPAATAPAVTPAKTTVSSAAAKSAAPAPMPAKLVTTISPAKTVTYAGMTFAVKKKK